MLRDLAYPRDLEMTVAVPPGGDVYLLCRVLAGWDDDAVVGVFENCRRKMVDSSSLLLILERLVIDEDSTVLLAFGTYTYW